MAKANDAAAFVRDVADAAVKAEDGASIAIGKVAFALSQLLGDSDRLSAPVVPMTEWATDGTKFGNVLARLLLLTECDADAIKAAVKAATSAGDGVVKRSRLESRARAVKRAMQLLGACAILTERFAVPYDLTKDGLRFPAVWFTPTGMTAIVGKTHRMHTIERTAAKAVLRCTKDDQDGTEYDGEIHDVKFSPTVQGIVDVAYGKATAKRGARAGGNDASEGADDAEAAGQAYKPATVTEAQDVLAKEAGRDDYKYRPTGERAEDWEAFFETCATNPFYRAMMVKAISRANKAEAENAKAA